MVPADVDLVPGESHGGWSDRHQAAQKLSGARSNTHTHLPVCSNKHHVLKGSVDTETVQSNTLRAQLRVFDGASFLDWSDVMPHDGL